ncbi:hypothetical protein OC835_000522 [Tilletia horrida]|nr:hypothetical protein OC835_000522 [Tilletia horrida]
MIQLVISAPQSPKFAEVGAPLSACAGVRLMSAAEVACRHLRALCSAASSSSSSSSSSSGSRRRPRPLVVGIQGPQGIGKSTLVKNLVAQLLLPEEAEGEGQANAAGRRPLRAASLSIDDLYLPHQALLDLKQTHPDNALLHGRGLPGTHDVALGTALLARIKAQSARSSQDAAATASILLPAYDKSLHDGAGDRLPASEWPILDLGSAPSPTPPLDIFLLEGWCLGFRSLDDAEIERRYRKAGELASEGKPVGSKEDPDFDLAQPLFFSLRHSLASLLELNQNLKQYERDWYPHIDAFIQLWPSPSTASLDVQAQKEMQVYTSLDAFPSEAKRLVFQWRLQAEHWMKSNVSQGKGMTDGQVRNFVARYMPAYELFAGGELRGAAGSSGASDSLPTLRIELDQNRAVVKHLTLH